MRLRVRFSPMLILFALVVTFSFYVNESIAQGQSSNPLSWEKMGQTNDVHGLVMQGKGAEALATAQRQLSDSEKAFGQNDPRIREKLDQLGVMNFLRGDYESAEFYHKRSLDIAEQAFGASHEETTRSLNALMGVYFAQNRNTEAMDVLSRIQLTGNAQAGNNPIPPAPRDKVNKARLLQMSNRHAEAEQLLLSAIRQVENLPDYRLEAAWYLTAIAQLYHQKQHYGEAAAYYKRTIAADVNGQKTASVIPAMVGLAEVLQASGSIAEAESWFKRALSIWEVSGSDGSQYSSILEGLSELSASRRDWPQVVQLLRKRADRMIADLKGGAQIRQQTLFSSEAELLSESEAKIIEGLIKSSFALAMNDSSKRDALGVQAFKDAQLITNPKASQGLAQMAARAAAGNVELSELLRQRQLSLQRVRGGNLSSVEQSEIAKGLLAADIKIGNEFPQYLELVRPVPLSVGEVQQMLSPDEAVAFVLPTMATKNLPQESFIWIVTKSNFKWLQSPFGTDALNDEVAALRCGLDYDSWLKDDGARCTRLTRTSYTRSDRRAGKPLPFDVKRSFHLYQSLLGNARELLHAKSLLFVASGALTQLPPYVLVSELPQTESLETTQWLTKNHAIAVLPSIAMMKRIRQDLGVSSATRPILAFGNPLLKGESEHPRYGQWYKSQAALANSILDCTAVQSRSGSDTQRSFQGIRAAKITKIEELSPLPETADEVCEVGRAIGAEANEIHLGPRATESAIKQLSLSGKLVDYRAIHIATHGITDSSLAGLTEPALVLSPPDRPSALDDGLLTVSEIAELKLNADLVILSACNTASGDGASMEVLSGFARAFFFARSRSVLVSHWEINSEATVKLVSRMMNELADRRTGQSEALRRAMRWTFETEKGRYLHPEFWSAFALVGEGLRNNR